MKSTGKVPGGRLIAELVHALILRTWGQFLVLINQILKALCPLLADEQS